MRIKWGSVIGGVAALAVLLVGIPTFLRHNTGAKASAFAGAFDRQRDCAFNVSHDSTVLRETFAHAINGGVHIVDVDSLHRILGDQQPVIAITHTVIDTTGGNIDTTISIYTEPPVDLSVLEHEYANALSWRHRRSLIGSDTGKFLTSAYYRQCVTYCPKCAAGAY